MTSSSSSSKKSAQQLLFTVVEACDALQPLVRALYDSLRGESATLKEDQSVFTIADGLVQQLLKAHLLKVIAPLHVIGCHGNG